MSVPCSLPCTDTAHCASVLTRTHLSPLLRTHMPAEGMAPLNSSIPSCGEGGALACSCGDCPAAPGCEPPPAPPPPAPSGCPAVGLPWLTCSDLALGATYLGLLACLPLLVARWRQQQAAGDDGGSGGGGEGPRMAGVVQVTLSGARESAVEVEGVAAEAGEEPGAKYEELIEWPAAEQVLRKWYYYQGRWCATRPWLVLAICSLLVGACVAGLARFRCGGCTALHLRLHFPLRKTPTHCLRLSVPTNAAAAV